MAIDPNVKSRRLLEKTAANQIRQVLQPKVITRHIALLNGTKMPPIIANSQPYMHVDPRIPKYAQVYALQDHLHLVIVRDYTDKKLNQFKADAPYWSDDIFKYEQHATRFINGKANNRVLSKSEDEEGAIGKINPKFANPEEKLKPVRKVVGPKTKTRKSRAVRSPPPPIAKDDGSGDWAKEMQAGGEIGREDSDDSEGSDDSEESEDERGSARKKMKVQVEAVEKDEESGEAGEHQDMSGFFGENSF